jgi:uncharacterized membrane protein YfcA
MDITLSVLFGICVGFALGLTGGGGSLLAVPLLVYGLAVAPRDAFGISLAAVGATALIGVVPRLLQHRVEVGTGVWFALAGMLGAPLGTWVAGGVPETVLLVCFSALMVIVASKMWKQSREKAPEAKEDERRSCQRTSDGKLRLTSRCAFLLAVVGLCTGFLSGMFGVGGGFVIVPALVLFSGMPIHRAIATSLLVIVLVSISGVASHLLAGRTIPPGLTITFILGGVLGLALGSQLAKRLSGPHLQRVFAGGIVAVALFVVARTLG